MVKTVLIAGATGFIGGAIARHLVGRGMNVICLLPLGHRNTESLPAEVRTLELPKFEREGWHDLISGVNADFIINAAATGVRRDQRDPVHLIDGNIRLPCGLLSAVCGLNMIGFLHLGSWLEYADAITRTPIDESAPLTTLNLYGASKAGGTLALLALAQHLNVPLTVLRLFHVYGPGERPGRLTPMLIDRMMNAMTVNLSSRNKVRDIVYINDVVEAVTAVLHPSTDGKASAVYNVCSGQPTTIGNIAGTVAKLLGRPDNDLMFDAVSDAPDEPFWSVGAPDKFRRFSGWTASTTLEDGLAATIADWRQKARLK